VGFSLTTRPSLASASKDIVQPRRALVDAGECAVDVSDESLLALICTGDRNALELLFHRHARVVRGVAYQVLRDPAEADDLLQDIFLLIHRICTTFDASKGSARHWILQMTYRRAISRRRYLTSRRFYQWVDIDQSAEELCDTQATVERLNDSIDGMRRTKALDEAFGSLSEDQRQTLRLYFFEGYALEEIAAKLGQSRGNVKHHYFRGLERLRRHVFTGKLSSKRAV
jgi:RNA polymerase sigma-70 factor (ECF subfamily)